MAQIILPENPTEGQRFNVNGLYDLVYTDGAWRTDGFFPGGGGSSDPYSLKVEEIVNENENPLHGVIDLSKANAFVLNAEGTEQAISLTVVNPPLEKAMTFTIDIRGNGRTVYFPGDFAFPNGEPELVEGTNLIIVHCNEALNSVGDPFLQHRYIAFQGPSKALA